MAKTAAATHVLVENKDDGDHARLIERHLGNATNFIGIVAFARMSGFELIREALAARVAKGLRATFVIGIDFFQSEPELLRALLRLRATAKRGGGNVKVYMGRDAGTSTLHPKVYWFKSRRTETILVGSANMTSGGFADNHELSVALTGSGTDWNAWLDYWIAARISNEDIVEATPRLIESYERRRDIYKAAMKAAERRARRSMAAPSGQIITLSDLLAEMRADEGPNGFAALVKRRRQSHATAQRVLAELAREPDLNRRVFLERYEEVIRYWHSGGLQRGKNAIAEKAARFQAALRAIDAERSRDPALLFDLLKAYFDKIPRAGTNVLTEILHTRDPYRYPVMNRNSVAGMGLANITGYPQAPAKGTVNGERYARFTADAETLRDRLGLRDFGELDVLFNYAYWKEPDPDDGD